MQKFTIKIHIGVECTSYRRMNSEQSQLLINLATCSDYWEFPLIITSRLSTPPQTSVKQNRKLGKLLVKTTKFHPICSLKSRKYKSRNGFGHEVGFVAGRRPPLPFFCSPTSMNPPGCQLSEFRARKMRYEPSRAILQRAPLNL